MLRVTWRWFGRFRHREAELAYGILLWPDIGWIVRQALLQRREVGLALLHSLIARGNAGRLVPRQGEIKRSSQCIDI